MREVVKVVFWENEYLNMDQIYRHLVSEYQPKKLSPFLGGYEVEKDSEVYRYTCFVIFINAIQL